MTSEVDTDKSPGTRVQPFMGSCLYIPKMGERRKTMIQRSRFQANPKRVNPNRTPNNKSKKLFCFLFSNLELGKIPDQAV